MSHHVLAFLAGAVLGALTAATARQQPPRRTTTPAPVSTRPQAHYARVSDDIAHGIVNVDDPDDMAALAARIRTEAADTLHRAGYTLDRDGNLTHPH